MAYNTDTVMNRDNRLCRFQFPGCLRRANQIVLAEPEYLGGPHNNDNARAACDRCAHEQRQQRNRAAELFNYIEGW
jgi:hypothetical protein